MPTTPDIRRAAELMSTAVERFLQAWTTGPGTLACVADAEPIGLMWLVLREVQAVLLL